MWRSLAAPLMAGVALLWFLPGCENTDHPPFPGPIATNTATPTISTTPADTPTPTATPTGALPTATATLDGNVGLGRRLFSLKPDTSRFELVGVLGLQLASKSVEGFLEFEAGPADPVSGTRPLTVTGASPFIEIVLDTPIGDSFVCVELLVGALPTGIIGEVRCGPSDQLGMEILQDHNITNIDPMCETGTPDTNILHAGVCTGPQEVSPIEGQAAPGGVVISDPETLQATIQVATSVEDALPCGDEDVEKTVNDFALITGLSSAVILDQNNVPGMTLQYEVEGENFDCGRWSEEDGPGKLVLAGPLIDYDIDGEGALLPLDVISVFEFDD